MRVVVQFKNPNMENLEQWMGTCFRHLLLMISDILKISPQDRVGFSFENSENDKINFYISFRRFDQYTPEVIMAALNNVLQSNVNFLIDDQISINVDHVCVPTGGSRRACIGKSRENFFNLHKRSIYTPILKPGDGNICLPVALIVGAAFADGSVSQNLYNKLTYPPNHTELISEAKKLSQTAGVDYTYGCGVDEIRQFESYFANEYNINVYASRDGRNVYHKSPFENAKHINLLLDNDHYVLIKSLTAVFSSAYFCAYCAEPYTSRLQHKKCPFKCDRCFNSPPCERAVDLKCDNCNREFLNANCFNHHIKTHICLQVRICGECLVTYSYDKKKSHTCGTKYCRICQCDKPIRHECYIPIVKPKKHKEKKQLFIFFDLECTQSKPFTNDDTKFVHIPNLCVSHQVCSACEEIYDINVNCENCGNRERILSECDVIACFMEYLGDISDRFKSITIIAHNLQKYDGHFLLQHMYENTSEWCLKEDSLVMNGTKILQIKIGRYRFIDSLNFFSVPLAKLPSMFSLNCDAKGHYPHFFNTLKNFNYVGKLPDLSYYGVDSMKVKNREEFLKWYEGEKNKNGPFDNKKEIIKYCKQDVTILRLACLKFRTLLVELTSVDPFDQITIAGTCMAIFKTNFIEKDQIAIIPSNGYRMRDNQSFKALKWLEWLSRSKNINIMSALNGREVRLSGDIIVDGVCGDTVYEFLGCYWHQCPTCFPHKYHNLPNNKRKNPARTLYETLLLRCQKIKRLGFKLVTIWEHEFDELLKSNVEIQQFINSLGYLKNEPLDPREAFFGGRTGVCKLYHKVTGDEKILYYDVTSLYPYINKYKEYPIGVPKILIGGDLENRNVFDINGIIKCRILPPKCLYHPVIPMKMHSKLLFVLCYKCALEKYDGECNHTEDERSFIGTYVAEELRVAVQKGYEILCLYEAWEYKTTKYDPITKTGGIFAQYIDTFLKIKTEASGFPSWCKTPSDKEKFIQNFYEKEGVLLEPENIEKNPGLRSLSKICLNSIWGKFGERSDKVKKLFINDRDQLINLVTDPSFETQSLYTLSSDALLASYKLINEGNHLQPNVNVAIAAYTTAHARLHLYEYLDKLQDRVLYYDTDSVFFVENGNDSGLALGDYLGDLTDELQEFGEQCYINEVVFTSEKSYAFTVMNSDDEMVHSVCKVKGISLNYENSTHINFEQMKSLVLNVDKLSDQVVKLNTNVILRNPDSTVYTTKKEYTFKVNATKRRRIGHEKIRTLPYGYRNAMWNL